MVKSRQTSFKLHLRWQQSNLLPLVGFRGFHLKSEVGRWGPSPRRLSIVTVPLSYDLIDLDDLIAWEKWADGRGQCLMRRTLRSPVSRRVRQDRLLPMFQQSLPLVSLFYLFCNCYSSRSLLSDIYTKIWILPIAIPLSVSLRVWLSWSTSRILSKIKKCKKIDVYIFWYLPWNGGIANVILLDLDPFFFKVRYFKF